MRISKPFMSFNSAFRRVESSNTVKAATTPSRTPKFPLINQSNEKMFWEEFRDSQIKRKIVSAKSKRSAVPKSTEPCTQENRIIPIIESTSIQPSQTKPPLVIRSGEEASAILSSPLSHYLNSNESPLSLPPKIFTIAESLVTARHADQILNRTNLDRKEIEHNPFLSSIAVHRLGKILRGKKAPMALIQSTESFRDLVEMIELQVTTTSSVPARALGNMFWALNRLDMLSQLGWRDVLISQLEKSVHEIPLDQIPSTLYTLVDVVKIPSTRNLRESVIGIAVAHRDQLPTTDLISVATSLARLGKFEKPLMLDLSDRIIREINTIPINDLVSVLWSITTLKVADSTLTSKLVHVMGSRISECSLRNLVDIVWSISKSIGAIRRSWADSSDIDELFRFTIAPAIRGKMMDCSVRELATILWSYSTVEVFDPDFFHDISLALIPKVSDMNAHDISSVLWALGSVNYSHKDLMSALKHVALREKNFFSPLQLSRVIYGLGSGGVSDKKVFSELTNSAIERSHLLYTQNLVEILIGLNYGKSIEDYGSNFLRLLSKQTDKISGRDAVQVLSIIGENREKISLVDNDQLVHTLVNIVKDRFNVSGRWIPSGYDVVDMVHAFSSLRLEDQDLLEIVLLHLSSVYKSPSFSNELFLRLLDGLATLCHEGSPRTKQTVSKLCLLRTKGIAAAIESLTEKLGEKIHLMSSTGKIEVLDWFSKVGYCDDNVEKLMASLKDRDLRVLRASVETQSLVNLCAASAELGIESDWIMSVLDSIKLDDLESTDDLVKFVWAKLAMGESVNYFEESWLMRLAESDPTEITELSKAHQVALSLQKLSDCETMNFKKWTDAVLSRKPWYLQLYPASSSTKSHKRSDTKSLSKLINKYSSLVSLALNQLDIKHSVNPVIVPNVYTVSIAVPSAKNPDLLIDVLGSGDVLSPHASKWRGSRVLKGIHLGKFPTVTLGMKELQSAIEANSLNPFIADKIAPYISRAKNRVQFIPQENSVVDDLLLGKIKI